MWVTLSSADNQDHDRKGCSKFTHRLLPPHKACGLMSYGLNTAVSALIAYGVNLSSVRSPTGSAEKGDFKPIASIFFCKTADVRL